MRRSPVSVRLGMQIRRILRQYGGRIALYVMGILVVIGCSVWLFPPLKYYATDLFRVQSFQFENVYYNNTAELDRVSEPFRGRVFWKLNRDELASTLQAVPWVESAQVSSMPGNRVTVVIREKQPVAIYRTDEGDLWIVDRDGSRIAKFTQAFSYRNFPLVSCDPDMLPFVVRKLERISVSTGGRFKRRLSELVVHAKNEKWECFLRDVPWTVYVDPFGTFRNVAQFLRVEKFIRARYDRIEYVDLSFQGQIIVKPM